MGDNWQIQITSIAICLIIFGTYMIILFIINVKIFVLIKWSLSPPPPPPIMLECALFIPLKYKCPNYCSVGIKHVYLNDIIIFTSVCSYIQQNVPRS